MSRGPRDNERRQRAISHISATESGPPEIASKSAGALFQSPNSRLASLTVRGEPSSSDMMGLIAKPNYARASARHLTRPRKERTERFSTSLSSARDQPPL